MKIAIYSRESAYKFYNEKSNSAVFYQNTIKKVGQHGLHISITFNVAEVLRVL